MPDQMPLFDRFTTAPLVYDETRAGDALAMLGDVPHEARPVLAGIAGSSGFLAHLIMREADWLAKALHQPPEVAYAAIPDAIAAGPDISKDLRVAKRRAALLIALADLGGAWPLETVTKALSDLADYAISAGLIALLKAEMDRGKLPMCTQNDLETACGMVVLGMGKLGAHELNYSSDIDLIVLFDETRFEPDDYAVVRKTFVRVTQNLVKLLSEMTADGYVFRTDLRLRPDPGTMPVCIAMAAAEQYYESVGRTWERAAMIKARPVAGDLKAGQAFLDRLSPFIWRRHLDFVAISEAQDMLLKIRQHKGLMGAADFAGYDVKLGRGGIREIEFFAQTHQLIFGGRHHGLRSRRTQDALSDLAEDRRIAGSTAEVLSETYTALRTLEHRIQMLDDAQTHQIPKSVEKQEELAKLAGFETAHDLRAHLTAQLDATHAQTVMERVGEAQTPQAAPTPEISSAYEAREAGWASFPALRNARAREIYERLRPMIMSRFATVSQPETALIRFEQFLSALPSGVQIFSLFESTPTLLDLLVDICAISPALAEYLGRNKSVLDAVLDRNFFEPFADATVLSRDLKQQLDAAQDYEQVLDGLRRWHKDRHFRNGVHLLRGISTPAEAAQVYSKLADVSVAALLPHVEEELARRFGPAPGRGVAILAMGKLGSSEMTASSDLDLIVIYDGAGQIETTGPKQVSVGTYFARYTQALISALTAPTSEGSLYEVDMRLRPSGRNGPVATSLLAFSTYQMEEAWTWEHLALTRARVIAGRPDLRRDVEEAIGRALEKTRDDAVILSAIKDMRAKLEETFDGKGVSGWETKRGPGRLLDIELFVQGGALVKGLSGHHAARDMIPALCLAGWLSDNEGAALMQSHDLHGHIQQIERLVGEEFDPPTASKRLQEMLANAVGVGDVGAVEVALARAAKAAEDVINQRLASA